MKPQVVHIHRNRSSIVYFDYRTLSGPATGITTRMHVSKPAAVMLVPAFIVTLVAAATNQLSQLAFNAGNELPGTHGGDFSHNKLITAEVARELDDLRNAWQIRGVQVAAVKLVDSEDESKGWITETAAFGEADREGRKMTDRVSRAANQSAMRQRWSAERSPSYRTSLGSLPTPNSSPPSPPVCSSTTIPFESTASP